MKRFIRLIICSFFPLIIMAQVQNWEWKTMTSTQQIRKIVKVQDQIYSATEGGMLLFSTATKVFETWTNTEGLASINIVCIEDDPSGNLWIGTDDGYLQRYDKNSETWLTIPDYRNYRIENLAVYGDTLFVALDIGISVYRISRQEVKETYKHLGNKIDAEIPVYEMIIQENELWAITEQGLSHVSLSETNPLDPQFWKTETIDPVKRYNLNTMTTFNGHLWLGTDQGILERQDDNTWILSADDNKIRTIAFSEARNALYALSDQILYKYDQDSWMIIKNDFTGALSITSDEDTIYVGTKSGFYEFVNDSLINIYAPNGPGGNLFSDIAVDHDGILWCCTCDSRGTSGNGLYKYDHGEWKIFDTTSLPEMQTNLVISVAVDQLNKKWIGTWGGGVIVMENDTATAIYRPQTGYLHGTSTSINYAVVKDIVVDYSNIIWILNREAYTGEYLVSVSTEGEWTYYAKNAGLTNGLVWDIAVDPYNRKWIGTNRVGGSAAGLYVYDDSQGTFDHWTTSDGLLSNNVQAVAIDDAGTVWIGTELGLNYLSGNDVKEEYRLPVTNIRALLIDGANNLWVGSDKGICYLSNETYEWTCFDHTNSGLVNDEVNTIALDPEQGYIYIGTSNGLSRLKTPYSAPKMSFSQLKIYPNPFIIGEHENVIIENLPRDVSVSIITSQGHTVYQKKSDQVFGNTLIWNGEDDQGNQVAAGIYLVIVNNESGEKTIGKLAVIR